MNWVLLVAIAIQTLALVWSVESLRRLRDWRLAFLTLLLALMVLRRGLALFQPGTASMSQQWNEVPALVISVLSVLAVVFLGKLLDELNRARVTSDRANAELAERERRLRAIIETEPECVKLLAPNGALLQMNPAGLRMIEADSLDQVVGRKLLELVLPEYRPAFAELMARVLRGSSEMQEFEIQGLRGTRRWLETHATPLPNADGTVSLLGITRDITERKRMEQALRDSQSRLQLLVKSSNIGLWDWNLITNDVFFSPEWKQQLGYADDELPNRFEEWQQRLHPEDMARTLAAVSEFLAGQHEDYDVEFRLRHKDGSWRWIMTRADLLHDPDGRPIRMMGCHVDITERKRAESALKESEAKYRTLFTSMSEGFALGEIICDAEGTPCDFRFLEVNHAYEMQTGLRADRTVGTTALELLPNLEPSWIEILGRVALTQQPVRFEDYNHNTGRHYELFAFSTAPGFFAVLFTDISVRKRAETALREREQQLRLFVEHSPAAIAMLDRDLRYLVASQRWLADYRLGAEPVIGRCHYDLFPEIPERWKEIYRRCLAGAIEKCDEDHFLRADGTTDWVRWEIRPWLTANGDVGGLIIFSEVITERKRMEETLRESAANLAAAQERAKMGSWELDLQTNTGWWSQGMFLLFDRDIALGPPTFPEFLERIHPDDRPSVLDSPTAFINSVQDGTGVFRSNPAYGESRYFSYSIHCICDAQGRTVRLAGTLQDVTERQRAEEELAASRERLAALSRQLIESQESERRRIARELHDELGQVLTAIHLNLQKAQSTAGAAAGETFDDSLRIVDRAIEQVRSMSLDLRPSMLDDFGLEAALRWYLTRQSERSQLPFQFTSGLDGARCSPEIETVCFRVTQEAVTNIVRHARASRVDVTLQPAGEMLELTVTDDGIGFDATAARRQAVSGSSVGLLSMEERVLLADGEFHLNSTPGRGTTVRLRLPLAKL